MEILIKKIDNQTFDVSIRNTTESNHVVILDDNSHFKLTQGAKMKEEIILFSFEFLLEREKNTSILTSFKLEIIQNYFPEYEKSLRNWANL